MPIIIDSVGSFLPSRVVENNELERLVDTSDQWIRERTGIERRHIATVESTLDLSVEASKRALSRASVSAKDIGLIIVATITPNVLVPSIAACVRTALGLDNIPAFDINSACTGFISAVCTARGLMETMDIDNALVIGCEELSRVTDWTDRTTCVLFGDGAGAVVLRRAEQGGILSAYLNGNNDNEEALVCGMPTSDTPFYQYEESPSLYIKMNGKQVFRFAVNAMSDCIRQVLQKAGKQIEDVNWFVPHQANVRIIDYTIGRLGADKSRFFVNLRNTGNTSSASVPIALDELNQSGALKDGDLVVLVGFGGGLSSGAILTEWKKGR